MAILKKNSDVHTLIMEQIEDVEKVLLASFLEEPVIDSLIIRKRNIFPTDVFRWIKALLHLFRFHSLKITQR